MAPKLYMIHASPPVRAVLMLANALCLQLDEIFVNLYKREHLKDEFVKLNPQHSLPTLDDNGFILWDSHAIMGYLVGKYGKNDDLYPKNDVAQRAVIDQRLHFDSSILFSRGFPVSKSIVFYGAKEITQADRQNMEDSYDILEKMLAGNKYVAGDNLSIADLSIISTLTTWDVLVPVDGKKCPNIKLYIKRMESVPCYESNKKGLEDYRAVIASKLGS